MLSQANLYRLTLAILRPSAFKSLQHSFDHEFSSADDAKAFARDNDYTEAKLDEWDTAEAAAAAVVEDSETQGIDIIPFDSTDFPDPLRSIPRCPPFLYTRGALPTDWQKAVALVGTRQPSEIAVSVTQSTVAALAGYGDAIIVSGLALGIDAVAHEAALTHDLRTVAVLGNALDTVYPRNHADLALRIIESGGAIISESPLGRKFEPRHLVERDRLQSGLSRAVFVMQSSLGGGTMHTASFALEQKRLLVALVPPNSDDDEWSGNRFLLKLGDTKADARFAKYERNLRQGETLALRLNATHVRQFVDAAVNKDFVPRGASPDLKLL